MPDTHPPFLRPASIEIRFAIEDEYKQAANRYKEALSPIDSDSQPESISFPVGLPTPVENGGTAPHSMELLLRFIPGANPKLTKRAIVYWEINATDSDGLKNFHQDLMKNHNYTTVDPSPDSSIKAQNDYFLTAERSLLTDKSGTLVGLIINPRIPIE